MKVIITGSSGFIGTHIIKQCISDPSITQIFAWTRKPLGASISSEEKVKEIIVHDFMKLDDVIEQCAGASACIWSLGITPGKLDMKTSRHVSVDYTMHALAEFKRKLQPQLPVGTSFKFAYISGVMVERDQTKKLWFAEEVRHIRGEVENALCCFAKEEEKKGNVQVMVARPAFVAGDESPLWIRALVMAGVASIRVEKLAETLLKFAERGSEKVIWENADLDKGL